MNQKIFAGVGNYIRAEALYLNKTSPWAKSFILNEDQVAQLCDSIHKIMEESYNHQGATISTYKDAYGAEGKYTSCFKVYGKKIDPNGYKIIKEESPDGRTIHWCPQIQLMY
jgi:formamidopyrimidine-DNA glycosylase